MQTEVKQAYGRTKGETVRMVVALPKQEADAIDAWGIPVGMPNRTAAVRELLRKGLEAAGSASQA